MTEENRDSGKCNAANEAWSKHWLVPIRTGMLRIDCKIVLQANARRKRAR
jgi:hypothetical protein